MMCDEDLKKWGCGIVAAILFFLVGIPLIRCVYTAAIEQVDVWKAEHASRIARQEEELCKQDSARRSAEELAQQEAAKKRDEELRAKAVAERESRLRSFVLKEAPRLGESYQLLQVQIKTQGKKIEDLRRTLVEFGKKPEEDVDFKAICAMREEMAGVERSLRKKMEDAYIAFCKFQAMPSQKEYDELRRKALEDGVMEAEAAAARYREMSHNK